MDNTKIARINELARKSKTPAGLTPAEKEEQARLRQEYIAAIRADLKSTLDNIDIKEKDGSITHVRDIPKRKKERNS
jgi:5-formyltetrahydrofolate cyclo-ligase